jgi:hypothetical protein
MRFSAEEVEGAQRAVYAAMPATPQYAWPLLRERLGITVWVKHENHTPAGAFKVRGGLVYFEQLARAQPRPAGVISATRGNHGQSVGWGARMYGMDATIVVPHGNSVEKNAAMRALGVQLIEHGEAFQAAREFAAGLARERGLHMVPSFDRDLVRGVATNSSKASLPGKRRRWCTCRSAWARVSLRRRRRAPTPAPGASWSAWSRRMRRPISTLSPQACGRIAGDHAARRRHGVPRRR